MRVLILLSGVIALTIAQDGSDGRYNPSAEGQYHPDNSGSYNGANDGSYHPDNSGAYVADGSGSYKGGFEKYVHTPDQFGGSGGGGGSSGGSGLNAGILGTLIGGGGTRPALVVAIKPARTNIGVATIGTLIGGGAGPRIGVSTGGTGTVTLKQGSAAGLYDNRNYAIIRKEETVDPDGYHYLYETENKIFGEEQGKLANVGADNEALQANGYYEYTGPDNVVYRVDYTANENGFVPSAAHIPTPPPIPEAIIRSLEYQRSLGQL